MPLFLEHYTTKKQKYIASLLIDRRSVILGETFPLSCCNTLKTIKLLCYIVIPRITYKLRSTMLGAELHSS